MGLVLEIPEDVAQAIRLPLMDQQRLVMTELALALYARGILSFGKARQLTELSKAEFGLLLGQRNIPRQYTQQDLEDDITYSHSQ